LGDPYSAALIERVARQPADSSLAALGDFVTRHWKSPGFASEALTLLRGVAGFPEVYDALEEAVIFGIAHDNPRRAHGPAADSQESALAAIESWTTAADLDPRFRATLNRARLAVIAAVDDDRQRDEARTGTG
jgi:hypothetical protein